MSQTGPQKPYLVEALVETLVPGPSSRGALFGSRTAGSVWGSPTLLGEAL